MVGMCCRYVGDRSVAEDLAHEAFLKAIEKSETYHHLGSFDGWLMRINLNTTLDYLRDVTYPVTLYIVSNNGSNSEEVNRQIFDICDKLGVVYPKT